jgi:hypothetical protein
VRILWIDAIPADGHITDGCLYDETGIAAEFFKIGFYKITTA